MHVRAQVFARALFTSKSRLLAWTHVHYMNTRGKNGLPKGAPFIASANKVRALWIWPIFK